jgi:nucleotide-binding universal stress UspA family protein
MTDTMVVGYDGSEVSRVALEAAIDLARARGWEIMLTCMVNQASKLGFPEHEATLWTNPQHRGGSFPDTNWAKARQVVADELEAAATTVRAAGVTCASTCERGEPAEYLVDLANAVSARLIVIGATGAGSGPDSLGSTARHLLETSNVPVLVVPKK